jgi:hypothetical protein
MNASESSTWVIDRLEGDIAVIELNGTTFDLPVSALPKGAAEGKRLMVTWAAPGEPKPRPKTHSIPDEIDL